MKRIAVIASLAAAAAAVPASALAQRADAIFDPITMDHHTPVSTLNVDFAYAAYDELPGEDLTVMGFALAGQYVSRRGVGIYGTLPLSYISVDNVAPQVPFEDSEFALGNLELGGLYSKWLSPSAALVLHAGLALPTAGDDSVAAIQSLAAVPRFGDFVQRVPESTWLRLGASPMGRAGKLFWRADVGLDLALDEDASDVSPVFHLNVGAGADLRTVHLLAELVTSIVDDESDDEVASTLAIGARFVSGNLRPGVALMLPVGNDRGNDLDFALAFSLAARL